MTKETDILHRIVNPDALIALEKNNYGKYSLVLTELNDSMSKVEIKGVPADCIAIKADTSFDNHSLLQDTERCGLNKRADFILISKEKLLVLFIEMKKEHGSTRTAIIQQLKGALCVFEYCRSIINHFFSNSNRQEPYFNDFQCQFICFKHTSGKKSRTGPTESKPTNNNTPEKYKEFSHSTCIQFNKLVN